MKDDNQNIPGKFLLCGFMGAGKSTLLRRLAQYKADTSEMKEIEFLDLDELIYQKNSHPAEDMESMILRLGWKNFRASEQEILKELVEDKSRHFVLALGGGALEFSSSWIFEQQIRQVLALVWLDTPFEECLRRAESSGGRPLLRKTESELFELYQARSLQYARCAVKLVPEEQSKLRTWKQLQAQFKK